MTADRYFDEALGAWITVCPPGRAEGADDIRNWGHSRQSATRGTSKRLNTKKAARPPVSEKSKRNRPGKKHRERSKGI